MEKIIECKYNLLDIKVEISLIELIPNRMCDIVVSLDLFAYNNDYFVQVFDNERNFHFYYRFTKILLYTNRVIEFIDIVA